jgi:1-hydroxycarotenoid 3,4-desaturase
MKSVAVIGGGFAGMTAAAQMASLGHRVVLFEKSNSLGGKAQVVSKSGVTLDTGPTLLTLPHIVKANFARIGASDLMPRLIPLPMQSKYLFSDGAQFDCHENQEATLASLAKDFSSEASGMRMFYERAKRIYETAGEPFLEAPFIGIADYMSRVAKRGIGGLFMGARLSTLHSLAKKCFRSANLHQFVGRFATYVGASPFEASAAYAMIPHLEQAYGVFHVEGGMRALAVALEAALRRSGVEVVLKSAVSVSQVKSDTLVQVNGTSVRFDSVIVNADPLSMRHPKPSELAMSGYVVLLKIARRIRLPHHTVCFGSDYRHEFEEIFSGRAPTDPTFYFCHPAASDPTVASADSSGLFCMINAPVLHDVEGTDSAKWQSWSSELAKLCIAKVLQLNSELVPSDIEVLGQRTPIDFADQGAPRGSIYGHLPHGMFGPFGRPHMKSPMKGVFFAGGGTHPGGGVPMVMLSGHFAASLSQHYLES